MCGTNEGTFKTSSNSGAVDRKKHAVEAAYSEIQHDQRRQQQDIADKLVFTE